MVAPVVLGVVVEPVDEAPVDGVPVVADPVVAAGAVLSGTRPVEGTDSPAEFSAAFEAPFAGPPGVFVAESGMPRVFGGTEGLTGMLIGAGEFVAVFAAPLPSGALVEVFGVAFSGRDCPAEVGVGATVIPASARRATTSIIRMSAMKETPIQSVHCDMMSSKLALPLKVVRTPPPPLMASPLPVMSTRSEKTMAVRTAMPISTL